MTLESFEPLNEPIEPVRLCGDVVGMMRVEIHRILAKIAEKVRREFTSYPKEREVRIATFSGLAGTYAWKGNTPWGFGSHIIWEGICNEAPLRFADLGIIIERSLKDESPPPPKDETAHLTLRLVARDHEYEPIVDPRSRKPVPGLFERSSIETYVTRWKDAILPPLSGELRKRIDALRIDF